MLGVAADDGHGAFARANASQSARQVVFSHRAAAACDRGRRPPRRSPREARRLEHRPAVLEDEAAAVEDRGRRWRRRGWRRRARIWLSAARVASISRRVPSTPSAERRRRDVDDDLGARVAAAAHRAVGRPDVLADLDRERRRSRTSKTVVAEGHAVGVERPARARRARTCAPRRRRCRSAASPSARTPRMRPRCTTAAALKRCAATRTVSPSDEHGAECRRSRGRSDSSSRRCASTKPRHWTRSSGVAADHLLRKGAERDAGVGHPAGRGHHRRRVAADGADGRAEAGNGQLHETHVSAYRVPACSAGRRGRLAGARVQDDVRDLPQPGRGRARRQRSAAPRAGRARRATATATAGPVWSGRSGGSRAARCGRWPPRSNRSPASDRGRWPRSCAPPPSCAASRRRAPSSPCP